MGGKISFLRISGMGRPSAKGVGLGRAGEVTDQEEFQGVVLGATNERPGELV